MTTTTRRFAQLLIDARAWDERHQAMCHAQEEWLLENFAFGDELCTYATPIERQKWDVPKVADGHLFTICQLTVRTC
jgi:hypothetical protein